jgi:hypothetical protein
LQEISHAQYHQRYTYQRPDLEEQKFIPYQVLTCIVFFEENERLGHRFETWPEAFPD